MLLKETKPGDTVLINDVKFKILRIQKIKVKKDTIRRHPERIRSNWLAVLQHHQTGRIRSQYFAENIECIQLAESLRLTEHAVMRERKRKIHRQDMEFVVKYGKYYEQMHRRIYYLDWAQIEYLPEYHHLRDLKVVVHKDIIITSYRKTK